MLLCFVRWFIRLFIFAIFVVCSFCGHEFRSLGRHSWRCKEKLKSSENDDSTRNKGSRKGNISTNNKNNCVTPQNCRQVKCCCGKICNGQRGLKMHQRSCRVVQGLGDITVKDTRDTSDNATGFANPQSSNITVSMPIIKPGIKLPKTDFQWKSANDYL